MGDADGPHEPGGGPAPARSQTFRFAGVELKPDDNPQEIIRGQFKAALWKNSIGSILAGALSIYIYRSVIGALASPYSFLIYVPFFYLGWAMYWGIRDCMNAEMMGEQRAFNKFFFRMDSLPGTRLKLLGVFGMFVVLIAYNLLGGGVYGFYKLIRQVKS